MTRFVVATLGMVILLALAMGLAGHWPLLALLYITVITYFLDKITALDAPDKPEAEFPAGDGLATVLGLAHFPLLFGGIWTLAAGDQNTTNKVMIFIALSLFLGQVGNSNAHELIHRAARPMRRLGVAVYSTVLFGFHASAHLHVHHVHAATEHDPNSARLGQSFYSFAPRAWWGALRLGFLAETKRYKGGWHPFMTYALWALFALCLSFALAGPGGILALIGLSLYAQIQLLLSDYVQHYGLRRKRTDTRLEPVGPQHSWNAPNPFSSALMLNAPRHSDHHAHPTRPYPGLELDREAMPILPHSLPVMAVVALVPPVWRRIMDKRARVWANPRP